MNGTFRFLNHTEQLQQVDWQRRHVNHLWSYNLHYFDYALDLAWAWRLTGNPAYVRRFEQLCLSWIDGTGRGNGDGWEPYPVSVRTVNWMYALLLCGGALSEGARERIVVSLATQLERLSGRLELHILANHLQKNLKALVIGGLFFAGTAAERWMVIAQPRLWAELFEQVLPDGGHFERSPMYHAIALGDYLEAVSLLSAIGIQVSPEITDRLIRMTRALGVLSRPDGTLHHFNDSADGVAPARSFLGLLSSRTLSVNVPDLDGMIELPETGYFGFVERHSGERLLVDCGPPGPSYQPGHAHCDMLSYELDIRGRRVVVDSGVSGYGSDPLREYVRSTRAHNTVVISGRDQSEVWGTFRVGGRARVRQAMHECDGAHYRFRGSYSPWFAQRTVHERAIERIAQGWCITDRVAGETGAELKSFIHLHPHLDVKQSGKGFSIRDDVCALEVEPFGCDDVRLVQGVSDPAQGWWCPEFGRAVAAPVIEMLVRVNDMRHFGYNLRILA